MADFDLVVIGGGPAGYVAAIRAAKLGMKTACIEKRATYGGTCLNIGCIPSKALLDSSEHFIHAKNRLKVHGVITSDVKLDLGQMMKRKEAVVSQMTKGIEGLFKKNKITAIQGFGKFISHNSDQVEIEVLDNDDVKRVSAKKVLIATGSEPAELPFLKFDGKKILSSTEALALQGIPKRLCVIGGGAIGLEMGSVWGRLGAKVTVVEFADRIAAGFDKQLAEDLKRNLSEQGFDIKTSTKCLGAQVDGDDIRVQIEDLTTNEKSSIVCDCVLVSVGRKPYSDKLGLDSVGLAVNEKGQIDVDENLQTKVPSIYAAGDIVRGPMLAHKAEEEGIAAVEHMNGLAAHVNYDAIPGVIYTWPELAAVGATEESLKEKGIEYKVGKFPFKANGRAQAMDEVDGSIKILADKKTDRVLGVGILGPRASDLIGEAVAVMEFGGSAEDIARTCHAHPTLSEVMKEAAMNVDRWQIHM